MKKQVDSAWELSHHVGGVRNYQPNPSRGFLFWELDKIANSGLLIEFPPHPLTDPCFNIPQIVLKRHGFHHLLECFPQLFVAVAEDFQL